MGSYLISLAFILAAIVEFAMWGFRSGPGWLLLTLTFVVGTTLMQRHLERRSPTWTWLLWLGPLASAYAMIRYDATAVHVMCPLLCIGGLAIASYWSLVGPVTMDHFAQPLPAPCLQGWLNWLPETWKGVQFLRFRPMQEALGRRLLSGLLLSVPVLLIFGGLLYASDSGFQQLMDRVLNALSLTTAMHIARVSLIGLLMLGYLRTLLWAQAPPPLADARQWDPLVLSVPLALLNLLFGTFLTLQASYLFGGKLYAARPGLPYSSYLHQGFFELSMVTGLVLVVVATVYRRSCRQEGGAWPLALSGFLILQSYGIGISAWQRFALYTDAYGFSVLRVYVAAGMTVASCLMAIVLWGLVRRRPLVWVASRLSLGLVLLMAGVQSLDVEGWVAQTNVQAILAHSTPPDVSYLGSLSADALPALQHVPGFEKAAASIRERCGPLRWQEFNWSRWAYTRP